MKQIPFPFKMVGVYILAAVIVLLANPGSCTRSREDCPEVCRCLDSYVDCASSKLEAVPPNLPKWTTRLDLHNNVIRKLNDAVWKNLSNLIELKLNKNDVTVMPKDAFSFQKQLKILELNRNKLRSIAALTFKSLEGLITLKLKRNQITQLKDGAFYGLLQIDKLILDYNNIKKISKVWLYGLRTLKELSISHNKVNLIEKDAWEFCPGLTMLDLSYNRLMSIKFDTFKYLEDLQKLVLNNNNITFIEEKAFSHLSNLRILFLNNNKISWTIEDANGVFRGLINLMKFHLAGNDIKSINKNAFVGLKNVSYLNLNKNNISSIQKNAFSEVPLLTDLFINTTSLICDCNLRWFYDWLSNQSFKIHTICAYPEWLRGQSLLRVPIKNFTCVDLPKPRLIEEPDPEIMALKGENVSLSCKALSSSNSLMKFQWKKDYVELHNMNVLNRTITTDGKTTEIISELIIYNVQHSNAGKYQCVVSNMFGTTYSQKSSISVLIYPTFLKVPANVTVQAGETAKLECAVYGEPSPEVRWQKDGGNEFPAARERRMHVMPTDVVFFIMDVKPSDMGIYSCKAHNAAGTIVANASLIVQEKPSFVKPMEDKEVTANELVVLQCSASGIPKPIITWLKDGEPIKTTERHFFTAEDQLMVIVDTIPSDSGVYECHLNNSLGQEIGYSNLIVKPGQILTHTATTTMGILIITVVCCAVATSVIWFVIIYQTHKRVVTSQNIDNHLNGGTNGNVLEFTEKNLNTHFTTDNTSEHSSSCKDSGTGDSAKRSNDDLVPDEYTMVVNDEEGWKLLSTASLPYIPDNNVNTQIHTPLLHTVITTNYHNDTTNLNECVVATPTTTFSSPSITSKDVSLTTTIQ